MQLTIFFPLFLFSFGAFSSDFSREIDEQLNRLITGNLDDSMTIGRNLNILFLLNKTEYFELILNSSHELTIPIAIVSLITKGESTDDIKKMVLHHLSPPSNDYAFSNMIVVLMQRMAKLIETTAFDYEMKIKDRVEAIGYLSQCYSKIFQILLKSRSQSGPCELERRIFNENMELWQEIFILQTDKRDSLLQGDPRVVITEHLFSLVKKINAEQNYRIDITEECIVRNLVKKILELRPSEFLPFLASKRPRTLCIILFFGFAVSNYRNRQFEQSFPQMAFRILRESSFDKKFSEYINDTDINGLYAKEILESLGRLARRNQSQNKFIKAQNF
jgi:hypothetical protein